jgi:hypothetical protein
MSFDNHDIYNEMEENRNYKKNSGAGTIAKVVASVLFLSIGFAVRKYL